MVADGARHALVELMWFNRYNGRLISESLVNGQRSPFEVRTCNKDIHLGNNAINPGKNPQRLDRPIFLFQSYSYILHPANPNSSISPSINSHRITRLNPTLASRRWSPITSPTIIIRRHTRSQIENSDKL